MSSSGPVWLRYCTKQKNKKGTDRMQTLKNKHKNKKKEKNEKKKKHRPCISIHTGNAKTLYHVLRIQIVK